MITQDEVYKIGRIGKPHGIQGEVHFLFDDDVFDRVESDYLILDIDGILVPFFMEEYRFRGESSALVKFCDIDTQDKAHELTNCDVYFPYNLTDEDPENIRWTQIIGFNLVDTRTQQNIGSVIGIDDNTMNILFEVETPDKKIILVPANEELIEEVNTDNKYISIQVPEGLLDL
ncbi:MAG: 16S rRNA processing protein RimM [Prevotella sp.]|nr:16S rRNA processing protein RimM [Prevotella sp.]